MEKKWKALWEQMMESWDTDLELELLGCSPETWGY